MRTELIRRFRLRTFVHIQYGVGVTDSNDKPSHTTISMEEAVEIVSQVEQAFAERNLTINTSSALGSSFAKVRRLARESTRPMKEWARRVAFLKANEAVRIARSVLEALDDKNATEAIHRIRIKDINLDTRWSSPTYLRTQGLS